MSSISVAQQINWVSFEEALELQKRNLKDNDGRLYRMVWSV